MLNNHMWTNEIGPLSYTLTKINSDWLKDLHISPETVKLLEENKGQKPLDIGLGKDFFQCDTKA